MDSKTRVAKLPLTKLFIDPAYQRNLNERRVKSMAARWDPIACGAISVSDRGDGTYAVVDGGHRMTAAGLVGIKELPCVISTDASLKEEARGFATAGRNSLRLTGNNLYKALLVAKDPPALKLEKLLREKQLGLSDGTANGKLRCALKLMKIIDHYPTDYAFLPDALDVVKSGWMGTPQWHLASKGDFVHGLCRLIALGVSQHGEGELPYIKARAARMNLNSLLKGNSLRHDASLAGKSPAFHFACQLVVEYNVRLTTKHKISYKEMLV